MDNTTPSPSDKPLSGPGTSRQTRRLALRNANFRALAVPTRKVTPKSVSSSTSNPWTGEGGGGASDAENVSPSPVTRTADDEKRTLPRKTSRVPSAALQDLDTATLSNRPRIPTTTNLFVPLAGTENYPALYADNPLSPPPLKTSTRPRVLPKPRTTATKLNANKRRSVSGETRLYIDHLESELAASHSALRTINSPSVTREKDSKSRRQSSDLLLLREELNDWEMRYDVRVRAIADEHADVEAGLHAYIRSLEAAAETAQGNLQELQSRWESARRDLGILETANQSLERRLEIMSELLATSPTKIELCANTPSRRKRNERPKSMLPRFPTASSLLELCGGGGGGGASPEHGHNAATAITQPTSPGVRVRVQRRGRSSTVDTCDTDSVFSSSSASSMVLEDGGAEASFFNPWTTHAAARPARRMRRFGAGSLGPKPLILPCNTTSSTVERGGMERCETMPVFPFSPARDEEEGEAPTRRASTMVEAATLARLTGSPFQDPDCEAEEQSKRLGSERSSSASSSAKTERDFSSLGRSSDLGGAGAGRNLLEELCAARTPSAATADADADVEAELEPTVLASSPEPHDDRDDTVLLAPPPLAPPPPSLQRPRSLLARLHTLFFGAFRTTLLARHLLHYALPRPWSSQGSQFWLVGVLLGPMARRRMLLQRGEDIETAPILAEQEQEERLGYGTLFVTPRKGRKEREGDGKGEECKGRFGVRTWVRFSLTLAVAVAVALREGPRGWVRRGEGEGCLCCSGGEDRGE